MKFTWYLARHCAVGVLKPKPQGGVITKNKCFIKNTTDHGASSDLELQPGVWSPALFFWTSFFGDALPVLAQGVLIFSLAEVVKGRRRGGPLCIFGAHSARGPRRGSSAIIFYGRWFPGLESRNRYDSSPREVTLSRPLEPCCIELV